ncbi:MAG: hypothetical protein HY078_04105 [Elusimicrobia bacterium]|nr:hypothetical protein [Elusimicrobiota bacterium]
MKKTLLLAAVAAAALATSARAADKPAAKKGTGAPGAFKGGMLVDKKGMTLYTFDQDQGGKSACNGPCAKNWPPLKAGPKAADMGDWTVVAREDGSKQWAFKGKPVYTWNMDKKAGDATGDGVKGVWHVVKDEGAAPAAK